MFSKIIRLLFWGATFWIAVSIAALVLVVAKAFADAGAWMQGVADESDVALDNLKAE